MRRLEKILDKIKSCSDIFVHDDGYIETGYSPIPAGHYILTERVNKIISSYINEINAEDIQINNSEEWIPCSEKMPTKEQCENSDLFWITYGVYGSYSVSTAYCDWIETYDDGVKEDEYPEFWIDSTPIPYRPNRNLVIAWKPIISPAPYQPMEE